MAQEKHTFVLLPKFQFLTLDLSTNLSEVVVYTFSTSDQFVERSHERNSNFGYNTKVCYSRAIAIHGSRYRCFGNTQFTPFSKT